MKAIVNLFLVSVLLIAEQASATVWPPRLSDLPAEDLALIEDKQLAGFSAFDFRYSSEQKTVGEHGIVMYALEGVLAICDEGIARTDNHYVLLYVEGERIKQVTNFSNYGCHKD